MSREREQYFIEVALKVLTKNRLFRGKIRMGFVKRVIKRVLNLRRADIIPVRVPRVIQDTVIRPEQLIQIDIGKIRARELFRERVDYMI